MAKNLAKQEKNGEEEVEEFELRKDTISSPSKTEGGSKKSGSSTTVEAAMPRAVLLSNVANIQQAVHATKPKLYDDDEDDEGRQRERKSEEDMMRKNRSPNSSQDKSSASDQSRNNNDDHESEEMNSSEAHNSSSEPLQQSESESKTN